MPRDTLSPGLSEFTVQPPRASTVGALPSMNQSIGGSPWPSPMSNRITTCGLVQENSLTVPETVNVFSRSYIAKEWWAETDARGWNTSTRDKMAGRQTGSTRRKIPSSDRTRRSMRIIRPEGANSLKRQGHEYNGAGLRIIPVNTAMGDNPTWPTL